LTTYEGDNGAYKRDVKNAYSFDQKIYSDEVWRSCDHASW